MEDSCSQKLASAKHFRLFLLILIPCICALILAFAILLSFVGSLGKKCLHSNGSDIHFPNMNKSDSVGVPSMDNKMELTPSTTNQSFHFNQMHPNMSISKGTSQVASETSAVKTNITDERTLTNRNWSTEEELGSAHPSIKVMSKAFFDPTVKPTIPPAMQDVGLKKGLCININYSQCEMLPYNRTTLRSVLSIVRSIEMEKFLKFFGYLKRLGCYQHIMLFGCSLALPQCISDGVNSHGLLPCRSFCEAAKKGCEPILAMVNSSWPEFLACSQFHNNTKNNNSTKVCFSPQGEKWKGLLCEEDGSFLCRSGVCIPRILQCNGFNDCDDWSDELHCNCSEELFRCDTGRCLNYTFVCDGYDDCGDFSDEQNCDCNVVTQYQCGDGRCIAMDWICDGDPDCLDKSDETNCSCHSQGLVECRNGQCVPSAFQCDGDNDCKDGSDEENCGGSQRLCHERDQKCNSTSCPDPCRHSPLCDVNSTQVNCSQCEHITLELCLNLPYNFTHYPNYLGHRTQKEASISWESSLFPALVQTNCYKYLMFFACTILVPKCDFQTNERIPPCRPLCEQSKERCESVLGIVGLQWPEDTDCAQFPEENSDNRTCLMPDDNVEECSPSHFKCRSGRCILASRRCDGQPDCEDDSDEDYCATIEFASSGPVVTELVPVYELPQQEKWLNLHPEWEKKNGSTLHALLVTGAMVNVIAMGLEGEANEWLAALYRRRAPQLQDVDEFLQELEARFEEVEEDQYAEDEFQKLKQRGQPIKEDIRSFHFKVMPFGLQEASAVFMQLTNEVLHEHLYKGVLVYMNDILIFTETIEDHIPLVHQVLEKLLAANLYVKLSKLEFSCL
ncbi:PREDICTED: atrial natriuretic peptide-converting enzyme [Thamnophis sirtalis]|uniref:ribonuclease H n=1 Tax=Thamnophis sirtalis TaxID=35019 RepID=A0A6I9YUJ7_9SAUR|nr:PREDICTED: atrial natriuretic peptide-converting enzyme [Thamnophis sirtalis]